MRARRLLTLFVTLLAPAALAAQDSVAMRTDLPIGARVRVHSQLDGLSMHEWLTGIVGHSTEGCSHVMLDDVMRGLVFDPEAPPELRISVVVPALDRLEISSLYDGSFIPETHNYRQYREGAPLEGETWTPVDLEAVQAREPAACTR